MNSDVIVYEENYKYRLAKPFIRELPWIKGWTVIEPFFRLEDGVLTLIPGYCWDGATGALDTDDIMRGSGVHDAGCQMTDRGMIPYYFREFFDQEFITICKEDKMSAFRRWRLNKAVRAYSSKFNPRGDKRKFVTAPKITV